MLIKRQINGKTTPVLFGAMSPEAAEILVQQVINADGRRNNPNPQVRPSNLVALEEIVQDLRKQDPAVIRAYVTDHIQESAVVPMLIEQGSKPEVLLQLSQDQAQPLWFIEDRRPTLETVRRTPGLEAVRCFLVSWGYLGPGDREGLPDGIHLLTSEQFNAPLAGWP
jgi:hypothetical protein